MYTTSLKAEFRTEAYYQAYEPSGQLQSFIQEYWIMHLDKAAEHHKGELELPKLYPEIIFKYGEDYEELLIHKHQKLIHKRSSISGINSYAKASKRVNTNNALLMIGIKFKPIGMYAVLNQSLYHLYDVSIPLSEINKPKLIELEEKLYHAKSRAEILVILNCEFQDIIFKNLPDSNALKFIKEISILDDNSFQFFINSKQSSYKNLERKFKKFIGTNPKRFFKLKRFNNFYKDLISLNKYRYIDLVYKHNYYDQNHLIKDFKAILNTSPNKFLKNSESYYTQHITRAHL